MRINLRCETCGQIRTPFLPRDPGDDTIVVICQTCYDNELKKMMSEPLFVFTDEPPPGAKLSKGY